MILYSQVQTELTIFLLPRVDIPNGKGERSGGPNAVKVFKGGHVRRESKYVYM